MAKFVATASVPDITCQILAPYGPIQITPENSTEALRASIDDDVIGLILRGHSAAPGDLIRSAKGLRVIGRTGVGYDTVDVDTATECGVAVITTPGANAATVAEASVAYFLALNKRIAYWDQQMKTGNWESRNKLMARDIAGLTVGIIGFGNIGQEVARMLASFQVTLIACDPYADASAAQELNVELLELEEVLARADTVCLHTMLTDQTRGLIDRRQIQAMKPGSFLINLSRGGVIESLDAIIAGLNDGPLAGAALDVFDPEPPDFDHPIFQHPSVLTAPHAMAMTPQAMERMAEMMATGIAAVLNGERPPRVVVNPKVLDRAPGGTIGV